MPDRTVLDSVRVVVSHGLWRDLIMNTHFVSRKGGITVGASVWRLPRLDVFVVGHSESMRHFGGGSSAMDAQLDVVHTFAHFTVLCALWTFPNAPVFVAETVSSSVGIITDALHALWEPAVILNIAPLDQKFPGPLG